MRFSAEPFGGHDLLGNFLTNHVLDAVIFRFFIPSIVNNLKTLPCKIKSLPTLRVEFPSSKYRVFFMNLPEGGFMQLRKRFAMLDGQLSIPTPPSPTDSTDLTKVRGLMIRAKVHDDIEEHVLKEMMEESGAEVTKVIRETRSKLPKIQLIQF